MKHLKKYADPEYRKEMQEKSRRGKMAFGVIIITFGSLWLLRQTGVDIPRELLSWEAIPLAIGLIELYKHGLKKISGWVLIAISCVFIGNDWYPELIEMRFAIPVMIIVFGFAILIKAFKRKEHSDWTVFADETEPEIPSSEDFVQSTAVFGGVTKNIVSKNFKGGKMVAVFGGTELNLLNADFEGEAQLELIAVFGGISIAVPSDWKIKSEITSAAFGGVDDTRQIDPDGGSEHKTLVIKGTCVFGGVEISNHV